MSQNNSLCPGVINIQDNHLDILNVQSTKITLVDLKCEIYFDDFFLYYSPYGINRNKRDFILAKQIPSKIVHFRKYPLCPLLF